MTNLNAPTPIYRNDVSWVSLAKTKSRMIIQNYKTDNENALRVRQINYLK